MDDFDVLFLAAAADVVDLPDSALSEDQVDGPAVVLYIKPIADILAFAIYGKGLSMEGVSDHEWNELFRELIRPVVVGTSRDDHRDAVGFIVSPAEEVSGSLACCVGAIRLQGALLGELAGLAERAVDLIRAYLKEGLGSLVLGVRIQPMGAGCLKEYLHPFDICLDEWAWIEDAPIDMGFGREVYDYVRD